MPYKSIEDRRAYDRRRRPGRYCKDQKREEKRRQRARWRAEGKNASGKPLVNPSLQAKLLAHHGHHPQGCQCFDCLWGDA